MDKNKRRETKTSTLIIGSGSPESTIQVAGANLAGKQTVSYRLVPLASSPSNSSNLSSSSTSGQVLVMMPNNLPSNREVLNQNVYIKRSSPEDSYSPKTVIDQKRRVMHKEIERRRRDKINDWILVLSKQVPDCASDRTKQGQSKGGILAKTAKYIEELRNENSKLNDILKEKEELSKELERQRLQNSHLEAENTRLLALLQDHSIPYTKPEEE